MRCVLEAAAQRRKHCTSRCCQFELTASPCRRYDAARILVYTPTTASSAVHHL